MTIDLFDMSNVTIFKEIEKKQKVGDAYTLLCLRSASLVSVWLKDPVLLQNSCCDASRVQGCWNLAKT